MTQQQWTFKQFREGQKVVFTRHDGVQIQGVVVDVRSRTAYLVRNLETGAIFMATMSRLSEVESK